MLGYDVGMSKKQTEKRKGPISYRPPAHLRDEFERRIERSGLTANAFLTQGWYGQSVPRQSKRIKLSEAQAGQTVGIMGKIKDEIKAIRQSLADHQDSAILRKIYAVLKSIENLLLDIRWAMFKLLGRKP